MGAAMKPQSAPPARHLPETPEHFAARMAGRVFLASDLAANCALTPHEASAALRMMRDDGLVMVVGPRDRSHEATWTGVRR